MSHLELVCAVADVTGDDPAFVDHRGFDHFQPSKRVDDNDTLVLDCPFCGGTVLLSTTGPDGLPEVAECIRCDTLFDYRDDEVYARDLFSIHAGEPRQLARAA